MLKLILKVKKKGKRDDPLVVGILASFVCSSLFSSELVNNIHMREFSSFSSALDIRSLFLRTRHSHDAIESLPLF